MTNFVKNGLALKAARRFSGYDHHELPIDFTGHAVLKIPYGHNKFISALGFHNTFENNEIVSWVIRPHSKQSNRTRLLQLSGTRLHFRRENQLIRKSVRFETTVYWKLGETVPGWVCDWTTWIFTRRGRRGLKSQWTRVPWQTWQCWSILSSSHWLVFMWYFYQRENWLMCLCIMVI